MIRGRAIVRDLMLKGLVDVVVSYETLMFVGQPYVQRMYSRLGIDSNYRPKLDDANHRYVSPCMADGHRVDFFDAA